MAPKRNRILVPCAWDPEHPLIEKTPAELAKSRSGLFFCNRGCKSKHFAATHTTKVEVPCHLAGCTKTVMVQAYLADGNNYCCKEHGTQARRRKVAVDCSRCGNPAGERYPDYLAEHKPLCGECLKAGRWTTHRGTTVQCAREGCTETFYRAPKNPQRFHSPECGSLARRKAITFICEWCEKPFSVSPSLAAVNANRFHSKQCEGMAKTKRPLDRMHNGKWARKDQNGYVFVWQPDNPRSKPYKGWMYEHILVNEIAEGSPLPEGWEVDHYPNDAKDDNRPENLVRRPKHEHTARHSQERWAERDRLREEAPEMQAKIDAAIADLARFRAMLEAAGINPDEGAS